MTRALPRAHFNSSRLTRFLTETALLEAAPAREDVGQKLGDWLNFRHAIALHGILHPEQQPATATPAHVRHARALPTAALARHVEQVRARLEQSITQGAPSGSGLMRIDMPPAELDEPIEPKTAFEPYRRFYNAHQRQMETALQTLRSQVRDQLNQSAAPLQALAALDAAFEHILGEREAVLLGKVPKLLEKRFVQTLKQHLKQRSETLAGDSDAATAPESGPLSRLMHFRQTLRNALLAELDTRMQAVFGLLEAFNTHTAKEP